MLRKKVKIEILIFIVLIEKFTTIPSIVQGDYNYGVLVGKVPSIKELSEKITQFFQELQMQDTSQKEIVQLNTYLVKFKTNVRIFRIKNKIGFSIQF